ncbi:MAG: hypothetical protein R3C14_12530 [Caldilineaceae bacterium]
MSEMAGVQVTPTQATQFQTELQEVQHILESELADLYSPLVELARNQLQRTQPLRRAALVLATGFNQPDTPALRQQRLLLAAAQEMLVIALNIHKLLLRSQISPGDAAQAAVTGGIILTGDYCFTRSAILAARTDHVQVVEHFSVALKTISEGLLRRLFQEREQTGAVSNQDGAVYHENEDLFAAGIQSAALLADLPVATTTAISTLGRQLAQGLVQPASVAVPPTAPFAAQLEPAQTERWLAFLAWWQSTMA